MKVQKANIVFQTDWYLVLASLPCHKRWFHWKKYRWVFCKYQYLITMVYYFSESSNVHFVLEYREKHSILYLLSSIKHIFCFLEPTLLLFTGVQFCCGGGREERGVLNCWNKCGWVTQGGRDRHWDVKIHLNVDLISLSDSYHPRFLLFCQETESMIQYVSNCPQLSPLSHCSSCL